MFFEALLYEKTVLGTLFQCSKVSPFFMEKQITSFKFYFLVVVHSS